MLLSVQASLLAQLERYLNRSQEYSIHVYRTYFKTCKASYKERRREVSQMFKRIRLLNDELNNT